MCLRGSTPQTAAQEAQAVLDSFGRDRAVAEKETLARRCADVVVRRRKHRDAERERPLGDHMVRLLLRLAQERGDVHSAGRWWRAVFDTTLLRVDALLAARPADPISLIASWRRPLLVAACAVVALLVPIEIMLERRETAAEQIRTLVRLSTRIALGEGLPTGAELSRALGPAALP